MSQLKNCKKSSRRETTATTTSSVFCSDTKVETGRSSNLLLELQAEDRKIAHEVALLREMVKQFGLDDNSRALSVSNKLEHLFAKHCVKEERMMYPLLRRCLGSRICTTLSFEHERISELMEKAANQIGESERFTFKQSISDLNDLMCAHFSREENVLFWYPDLQSRSPNTTSI